MSGLKEGFCRAGDAPGVPASQWQPGFYPRWPELSLRCGVVPFRSDLQGRPEYLLMRRIGHEWWSFPKGHLTPGRSMAHSAAMEAYEEAGVRGALGSAPLGSYQYRKAAKRLEDPPRFVELVLFSLKVEIEVDEWPERGIRQRRWFDQEHALLSLAPGPLRDLLRGLNSQLLL